MIELEILKLWIVPQQGKNHSEIDEEPEFESVFQLIAMAKKWPVGQSVD